MKKEKKSLTREQKSEIIQTAITVLLALVAVIAIVSVGVYYVKSRNNAPEQSGVIKNEISSLNDITLSAKTVAIPYVQTDINNIVYTANSAGTILFYEFNGTDYVQIVETGNTELVIPLSGQQIPVTVHYIERDGKITGYGVFTANENDSVFIYDFVLCKITNLPKGYEQKGKYLLLANTDIDAVYSNDPVWEESFTVDLSSGKMSRFISDGNRTLDSKGAMRADFATLTNEQAWSNSGIIPFFSGRAYEGSGELKKDLFIKNKTSESVAVKDVIDNYAKQTSDGGIVVIKAISGGFATEKYLNGKTEIINEFYSVFGEQFIRHGDWLLSREDGRIYSTYSDKVIELPEFVVNPSDFIVSDNGKYVVLMGMASNAADYQIWIYNTETLKKQNFSDNDFSEHFNLFFAGDNAICFYTASAEGYSEKIIDISKIS